MARATYTQQLNSTALRALLASPRGAVARDLLRRGILVESQAKRNLSGGASGPKRIDTGRLRASIATVMVTRDGAPACLVGTDVSYARFVHDGTGVHGPRHQRIRPRRAKVMRWRTRTGGYRYARSTQGMVANPFLTNALSAARG